MYCLKYFFRQNKLKQQDGNWKNWTDLLFLEQGEPEHVSTKLETFHMIHTEGNVESIQVQGEWHTAIVSKGLPPPLDHMPFWFAESS